MSHVHSVYFSCGVKQNQYTGDSITDSTELKASSTYYLEFDEEHLVLIKQ